MKSLLLASLVGLSVPQLPVQAQNAPLTPVSQGVSGQTVPLSQRRASERKRIAIVPFDFGSIKHWWGNDDWDIGRDLSDMLKVGLVNNGAYSVLERKMLDQILGEQAISASGIVDPRSMIQMGRLLGVNAVIVGSVTQFGFDERTNDGFLGMGRSRDVRAIVAVNARIVDPVTGEVLGAVAARGEEMGRARPGGAKAQGGINMSKCTFENTYMAGAVKKCMDQLVQELAKAEAKVRFSRMEARGKVADFDGDTVIFNIGSDSGIMLGDALIVEKVVRQVKDPDTGRVIRDVTEQIGTVVITKVDALSACGRWEGKVAPQTGDIARRLETGR
jgi:curli biogenesis system outer membrane secretion channel CsgG